MTRKAGTRTSQNFTFAALRRVRVVLFSCRREVHHAKEARRRRRIFLGAVERHYLSPRVPFPTPKGLLRLLILTPISFSHQKVSLDVYKPKDKSGDRASATKRTQTLEEILNN